VTSAPGARERFAALVAPGAAEIDLPEAALWIAAEEYPDLDVAAYLARLDALAAQAAPALRPTSSQAARIEALNRFLFEEQGFAGNREHYDDPRNSFLNEVLDRRRGIPITLSLVYVEVARRLGLAAFGVSFPGHFLAKVGDGEETVVDAFFGRVLTRRECQERLDAVAEDHVPLRPELHLRAATPRETLVRMLANLKHVGIRSGDYSRALAASERILLVEPGAVPELRDRGLLYERLECYAAALADLRAFLERAPGDASAAEVRARMLVLEERVGRFH
jgi:regulator of sirC expression with transglutaminase-like and TPR domain